MIKKLALAAAATLGAFTLAGPALAVPVTFESVCVTDCDGDAGFSLTVTLDDGVIAPNASYDTTSDAGAAFLGWTASSDVGGGFSISGGLGDIVSIGLGGDTLITFTFDANELLTGILNNDGTPFLIFLNDDVGVVVFREPNEIDSRERFFPDTATSIGDPDDFLISFQVQQTQLPEPASLALFGVGLLGLGVAVRRRERSRLHAARTVIPARLGEAEASLRPAGAARPRMTRQATDASRQSL